MALDDNHAGPELDHAATCIHGGEVEADPVSDLEERLDLARAGTGLSRRSIIRGLAGLGATSIIAAGATPAAAAAAPEGAAMPKAATELVLLGTRAGPPPNSYRAGISSAIVVNGSTYLVDCGRASVTQYIRAGLRLDSLRAMFITHLHVDHVSDYYNYFLHGAAVPNSNHDLISRPVKVYGPGPAGGLPPKFGGGTAPTIAPDNPTPGLASMTEQLHSAYAYSTNIFMRDGIRDPRTLTDVHEIQLPSVGASFENTAPLMAPFEIYRDDNVVVSAILVDHGPVFPSFAYRFDTEAGSVTFSGDTTKTPNLPRLAHKTDILVHEAIRFDPATTPDWVAQHHLESHVLVEELGPVAQAAEAGLLVMSHVSDATRDPLIPGYWVRMAGQGYSGKVILGSDLQRLRLN